MPDPYDLPRGWTRTARGYRISPEQRQYLTAGLRSGLSVSRAIDALRAGGLRITEQAAYDVAREYLGGARTAGRANAASDATVFGHGEYQQIGRRAPDTYRVGGRISLGEFSINDKHEIPTFVNSKKLLTVGEYKAALYKSLDAFFKAYQQQLQEAGIELTADDITFDSFESFLP